MSKENINNVISIIEHFIEDKKTVLINKEKEISDTELGDWYVEIPSIKLKAPITEGTEIDTLNTKVGHFEETDLTCGNVGLAAHNRGYEYNFFKDLRKVKIDDKIIYTYKDFNKTYIVEKNEIIENSDWSFFEKSEENKITLITCVENEPQYRRCVQAIEKK